MFIASQIKIYSTYNLKKGDNVYMDKKGNLSNNKNTKRIGSIKKKCKEEKYSYIMYLLV